MKKLVFLLFVVISTLYIAAATPTVVAVVNGYKITSDFLNTMADMDRILMGIHSLDEKFFTVLTSTQEGLAFLQRYREAVLSELVDQLLIQQLAEKEGVAPSASEVEEAVEKDINDALKNLKMKREDFEKYLSSAGMDMNSLKERLAWMYRTSKSLENLKEKVTRNATVSEDEIKSYYGKIKTKSKVHLYAIFLKSKSDAEKAMKRIENGEAFTEVASDMSIEKTSAAKGGDLGFLDVRVVESIFGKDYATRIEKASEGAILGPYKMGRSWVIFMVKEKKKETLKYEDVKKEIEKKLLEEKKEEIWNKWWKKNFEAFKKSSDIKILLGGSVNETDNR